MRFKILFLSFVFLSCFQGAQAQDADFWYEAQLKKMTLDEKIGQLYMVAAYSNRDAAHVAEIDNLIINYHIGGLIFFQNDPLKQAYLTNYYQAQSTVPLMIGIDGEWGLAMRLQNTQKFPYALTLGALASDSLMYQVGAAIALQCKRMGIHINFAPDVDINTNPKNPVIGFRSFGDNKYRVAQLGAAYSKGMMSEGVLSCAKHFPGHGDVAVDSHHDLPVVDKSLAQIDTSELYPFYYAIKEGVASIMVGHINYPQLDNRPNRSASLSAYIIDTLLKQKMHFEGLVFTDAMNMKGVAKYYSGGEADLEAFRAGNDVILFSDNVVQGIARIKQAISQGLITEKELDSRVLKILKYKQNVGLHQYQPIPLENLEKDLQGEENKPLLQAVANHTVSVIKDQKHLIPLASTAHTVGICIGEAAGSQWSNDLKAKGVHQIIQVEKNCSEQTIQLVLKKIENYSTVILSMHSPKVWSQQNGGYSANDFKLIQLLAAKKNTIVVGFCNPYVMQYVNSKTAIIAAYEDLNYYHQAALNILFGHLKSNGKLPVNIGLSGVNVLPAVPTSSGKTISNEAIQTIDALVAQLIQKKGAPGCRVYALKDGKEIFNKSYGYLNYNKKKAVNDSTMYDIASITKIAATTLAVMKLYDEGKLNLDATLGDYLPQAKGTNKENLVISDILQHRAGLTAWIPFYKETLPYVDSIYCSKADSAYCIKVADKFFMLKANKDTIYKRIFSSALESRTYRYSDLSMILMQLVVEKISGIPLDIYVNKNFYQPMGLKYIGFLPWKNHDLSNIAPTQEDRLFRQQEICGYVHDPGAAMLGGVSGHAGVFSTVADLGAIMQMLNDGGLYKGQYYISKITVTKFTSYQRSDSRRGLGFDKPDFSGKTSPSSTMGSTLMFGHTGFTGTCVWADPKYNLVFVFLSNRICPDEENKELIHGNYRTRIQDVLYKAIEQ
ncbi:MAG: glycoside hydrolase family 3 N-terminal domain-containing protein [bacterium]|nr:glycoside hydrolase family 3 N-terminal domain-containing protein [bacterium]